MPSAHAHVSGCEASSEANPYKPHEAIPILETSLPVAQAEVLLLQ